jgi:hypothetical protein
VHFSGLQLRTCRTEKCLFFLINGGAIISGWLIKGKRGHVKPETNKIRGKTNTLTKTKIIYQGILNLLAKQ